MSHGRRCRARPSSAATSVPLGQSVGLVSRRMGARPGGRRSRGTLIGMQGLHARGFATRRTVDTGSWVGQDFQRRGFGKEMRAALLALAFDGLGAQLAETEAFLDNAASNAVSRALGYEENGFGSLAPEGVPRETQRFRMTARHVAVTAATSGHDRGSRGVPRDVWGRLGPVVPDDPCGPCSTRPQLRPEMAPSAGYGGPARKAARSSTAACLPLGNWSSGSSRQAATIARTRTRQSSSSA